MGTAKIFLATVRNEVRKLLRKPIRRSVRPATREMNSIGDQGRELTTRWMETPKTDLF